MTTITKLYPLLKDIGLDDKKSQEFIEIIEVISLIREALTKETSSIRERNGKHEG